MRVGFDIGGTFTDFAMLDTGTGELRIHKTLTTPSRPAEGALDGMRNFLEREGVRAEQLTHVVHGTTLVANALIEHHGARVGLITTRGFRDTLEIRTEQRYEIYDLFLRYPDPLVPRWLRRGVAERTDRDGRILQAPDPDELRSVLGDFRAAGVEVVAVCFLHAFRNPANERAVREIVREAWPEVPISLSSEVAPQIREYERTSTTVANAFVQPLLAEYLETIQNTLDSLGFTGAFYPVLSSGGTASVNTAIQIPIQLVESGPAAGATAAAFFGELSGRRNLVSFDMGGTTAKLCLIENGRPSVSPTLEVARVDRFQKGSGIPLQIPTVEMLEIGAGGGSVAWVDSLDLMRVGPRSAGADPGPACYGLGGTEPTVTDADVLLGYLNPDYFLGGTMALDVAAAESTMDTLASHLGQTRIETAWAIHQLVNEHMAAAARIHVIERSQDPRRFAMLAFGGCGPVHAAGVAQTLSISHVICPPGAGVASAIGLLVSPPSMELARSFPVLLERVDWGEIAGVFGELEERARAALGEVGVAPKDVTFERAVDGRFAGQLHELTVPLASEPLGADLEKTFFALYREQYRHLPRGIPVELLSWRLTARGPRPPLHLARMDEDGAGRDVRPALKGRRPMYFGSSFEDVAVYDRYLLRPGMRVEGPAVVEERESTTVVRPTMWAEVDTYLNLVVHL